MCGRPTSDYQKKRNAKGQNQKYSWNALQTIIPLAISHITYQPPPQPTTTTTTTHPAF